MGNYDQTILYSRINTLMGGLLLASVALGAALLIWHTAHGTDPLERTLTRTLYAQYQ